MLFNSHEFVFLFLPITLFVFYSLIKIKKHNAVISWLALTSLAFYAWWSTYYLLLLLLSICFNYCVGRILIYCTSHEHRNMINHKYILLFGIIMNLSVLAYYKYYNFFVVNLNRVTDWNVSIENIVLPIGISFFTFTQIAFLVDAYRGLSSEYKFINYVLFVTFFPHLIAGPILHHREMMPQFEEKRNIVVNWENITVGTVVFILGLFKKVLIADNLSTLAVPIFSVVSRGGVPKVVEAWVGALAYSLQLYFDFSGYSDMAVGLGLLFNIKLPVNFFSPYKATSIIDFWHRWHITLSRYLKDYLYIPLGGNRLGEMIRLRNIMLTMLLGGLWHGAGWNFIVWGALHGIYLVINHLWRKFCIISFPKIFARGLTFFSVVVAWVFFRADNLSNAITIIQGMFGFNGIESVK